MHDRLWRLLFKRVGLNRGSIAFLAGSVQLSYLNRGWPKLSIGPKGGLTPRRIVTPWCMHHRTIASCGKPLRSWMFTEAVIREPEERFLCRLHSTFKKPRFCSVEYHRMPSATTYLATECIYGLIKEFEANIRMMYHIYMNACSLILRYWYVIIWNDLLIARAKNYRPYADSLLANELGVLQSELGIKVVVNWS